MKFDVKALGPGGDVLQLAVDAGDMAEARRLAAERNLAVVSIRARNPALAWLSHRRLSFKLDLFGHELVALLDAGLSLVEAMELLATKEHGTGAAAALGALCADLRRGLSFSAALARQDDLFPSLFVTSVRAAERSSNIQEAVTRYLAYRDQIERVRRKVVSASVYPAMLAAVGLLVSAFMLLVVVPKFSRIYEEIGGELPWLTRLLIGWGQLLESHAALTLGALLLLAALAWLALRQPATRRWLAAQLWRVPALGERMRVYELARFYRTLGMLLAGGIALPAALDMAAGLLSPLLRQRLALAARDIRAGLPVSRAFEQHGLSTPVAQRLLAVGERSGRMPHMVERIAQFHEDDLARWVDWFTRLFEPVLMVLIGALVGLIVVLLYLPIFELAENIR